MKSDSDRAVPSFLGELWRAKHHLKALDGAIAEYLATAPHEATRDDTALSNGPAGPPS